MRTLLLYTLLFIFGIQTNAQEKNKNAKYTIEVNGNCGQCKKRIEKAALAVQGVKMATWNSETLSLNLILNEEKTDLKSVETAIAKVGHDTPDVKATKEDYENLHSCCKYERK